MRLAALTIPALVLLVAGCATPEPDVATLPHATIVGTHVDTHVTAASTPSACWPSTAAARCRRPTNRPG